MQKKANFYLDNPEIAFQLKQKLDISLLFEQCLPEDRQSLSCNSVAEYSENWQALLENLGEVFGTLVAGNAAKVSTQDLHLNAAGEVEFPPALKENMAALLDMGLASCGVQSKYGGLGAPILYELAATEMLYRACPSTTLNFSWFSSIARVIDRFGSEPVKAIYLPLIAAGKCSGSMALTEADAGSDLGNLRTYGEKSADGTWRLYGAKRFITNGCGDVSLVLAKRAKGAQGLQSLNLFLCPRYEDGKQNYQIAKLEDKVGLHGSATCELVFNGSQAILIGDEGAGFRYMLDLMNEARIAIGFQGLGVMEGVYRLAHSYATTRHAWGKPIAEHELIKEKLLDMETEIMACRSLSYKAAHALAVREMIDHRLQSSILTEDVRNSLLATQKRYEHRLRRLTPLVKYYIAEKAVAMARTGMQIHGGYSYTKEYRAEWWLRESLILPIYEGTSQIQALMCMKDSLKDVIRRPGKFIETALGSGLRSFGAFNPLNRKIARMRQITTSGMLAILMKMIRGNMRDNLAQLKPSALRQAISQIARDLIKFQNLSPALTHAERLCEMKALVALSECLAEDAKIDPSRQWAADRFVSKALLRVSYLKDEIDLQDSSLTLKNPAKSTRMDAQPLV